MNIALWSHSSSYVHLSKKFIEQGNFVDLYYDIPTKFKQKPMFFMSIAAPWGITSRESYNLHKLLTDTNTPHFFVNHKGAQYESNKFLTKNMCKEIGIPTASGVLITGKELKSNFYTYTKPFVIKLDVYQYGRQTIIVDSDNSDDVYQSLFGSGIFAINEESGVVIEEYVELKSEYSYHALFNKINWQFFGAARDYKKINDGDAGPNSMSSGAYSTQDVHQIVHEYADKIYNYFKTHNLRYRGFIFLGIGVRKDGVPILLEINTRSGDPELQVMVECIDNNLAELFFNASSDFRIPEIKFNGKQAVTVSLINKNYNWKINTLDVPNLKNVPNDIIYSMDYPSGYLKYGALTAVSNTRKEASDQIYKYLNTQYTGQYRYRTDIGILE